jgi:alpha-L-fucosidase 2
MLLQSRALETEGAAQKFEVEVLPALPSAWPNGSVTGLRARGGFEAGLDWANGKLTKINIHSVGGRNVIVRYGDQTAEIKLKSGGAVQLDAELRSEVRSRHC